MLSRAELGGPPCQQMDVFFLKAQGARSLGDYVTGARSFAAVCTAERQDGRILLLFFTLIFFQVRTRAWGGEANPAE